MSLVASRDIVSRLSRQRLFIVPRLRPHSAAAALYHNSRKPEGKEVFQVPVGRATLGRVINAIGEPIDGQGDIKSEQFLPVHRVPPPVLVKSKEKVLWTGIKCIDLLAPFRRGGSIGLFGDRSAKNALVYELINNFNKVYGVSVYAEGNACNFYADGKRCTLESSDVYQGMIRNGIILRGDKQADSKCALVYCQMRADIEASSCVDLVGLTLAEHFRDAELQNVLLFMHNCIRMVKQNGVMLYKERIPAVAGHTSVTSVELKDRTEFSVNQRLWYKKDLFTQFDSGIVLSAEDARLGVFPAIDHLLSMSRVLSKKSVGDNHYRTAKYVMDLLADYNRWKLLPECELKERELKDCNTYMMRARKVVNFLTQPPGKFVTQDDCVDGFARILNGDFDHIPEEAFSMIGAIDEISGL